MDIYTAIRKDHSEIRRLLAELMNQPDVASFERLRSAMHDHIRAEESVFYSRLEDDQDARADVLKGYEEHHVTKAIMRELNLMSPEDERFPVKASVYGEILGRHFEHEENVMFEHGSSVAGDEVELGLQYESRKTFLRNCCYWPRR